MFNTAYVLADRETATDVDFERVEGVIGHEYFHNWTGNRYVRASRSASYFFINYF